MTAAGTGPTATGGLEAADELLDRADAVLGLVPPGWDAAVRVHASRHALTRFANSRIHQNVTDERTTVTVLLADGGRAAVATTNRVDGSSLADLVARAREAALRRPPDPHWPGPAPTAPVLAAGHWDDETASAEPAARATVVAAFVAEGASGQEAAGYCDSEALVTALATSAGQRAVDRATRATVDGIFTARPEGGHTPAGYGHQTSARLVDLAGGARGAEAADGCARSSGAGDLPPGDHEVVLLPECVAELAAFLGAYGFNAKAVQDGESFVALGAAAFDPAFTLTDDVYDARSVGVGVDADGTPRRRVALVDGGRCQGLVHDRRTAGRDGTTSTGHALALGSADGADAANLVVGQGTASLDDLVGGVARGVLVTCFNYCRVLDPKTVGVTGLTRNGTFLVEDGAVVRPVTNLRFTQSFVDALGPGRVRAVGGGARLADCEWGPGRVVAPALRLASWHFTGGAAG